MKLAITYISSVHEDLQLLRELFLIRFTPTSLNKFAPSHWFFDLLLAAELTAKAWYDRRFKNHWLLTKGVWCISFNQHDKIYTNMNIWPFICSSAFSTRWQVMVCNSHRSSEKSIVGIELKGQFQTSSSRNLRPAIPPTLFNSSKGSLFYTQL